jgi:hypothetical protein
MRENIWAQKAEKRISEEHPDTEDESKNIGRTSGHRRKRTPGAEREKSI